MRILWIIIAFHKCYIINTFYIMSFTIHLSQQYLEDYSKEDFIVQLKNYIQLSKFDINNNRLCIFNRHSQITTHFEDRIFEKVFPYFNNIEDEISEISLDEIATKEQSETKGFIHSIANKNVKNKNVKNKNEKNKINNNKKQNHKNKSNNNKNKNGKNKSNNNKNKNGKIKNKNIKSKNLKKKINGNLRNEKITTRNSRNSKNKTKKNKVKNEHEKNKQRYIEERTVVVLSDEEDETIDLDDFSDHMSVCTESDLSYISHNGDETMLLSDGSYDPDEDY